LQKLHKTLTCITKDGDTVNSNSSKMEPKGLSSSRSTPVTNQSSQLKTITRVCSLLWPKKDQNSSRASQQALTLANPSFAGSQYARHADALWPNNCLTQVSRRTMVLACCHATRLLQIPANHQHRYPKAFHHPQG